MVSIFLQKRLKKEEEIEAAAEKAGEKKPVFSETEKGTFQPKVENFQM